MPYPHKDEQKSSYVSRFMESGEARKDFPDDKQRLAVAHSMFEKRNALDGGEHPWPKKYVCNFIEPGTVFYQDLGLCKVCGDDQTCEAKLKKACDTPGERVLVTQDALAKMSQTFVGKPVIDKVHKDVEADTVAKGEADGIVTRVWFDAATAWWMCEFLVWNPETQEHCESLAYSVSCAYDPTDVGNGGTHNSEAYHEEVRDGVYTHLAVVTNPRYERARISLVNSIGGKMNWKFWKKGDLKNAAPVDPLKEMVNVDGKDVPMQELYDALPEEPKREEPKFNDDTVLETPKGQKSLGDMKNAYRAKMKKNAEDLACPSCKGSGKKNAEELGEKTPLPDLRDEKQNLGDEAGAVKEPVLDAAKKENVGDEAGKPAESVEAEAKKNADDAAALKLAEEKKNADDAAALKLAEEKKKNADDAAAAEKAEKEERRNSGRAAFASLKNAASERSGVLAQPTMVSREERISAGNARYGSAK